MDVHLVHKSADGKLAVIGVRFHEDASSPNALLATLWAQMPTQVGQKNNVASGPSAAFCPATAWLLDLHGLAHHSALHGEGVRWFVLEQTFCLSAAERSLATLRTGLQASIPGLSNDTHSRRIEANQ